MGFQFMGFFSLLCYRLTRVSQKDEMNHWWVAWTDNDMQFIVFVLTTFRVECHCWKTSLVIVIFVSRVLTYVVCYKLFWNWICVLWFVVHKVLFDKGIVVQRFLHCRFVQIASWWSLCIWSRIIFTPSGLVDKSRHRIKMPHDKPEITYETKCAVGKIRLCNQMCCRQD